MTLTCVPRKYRVIDSVTGQTVSTHSSAAGALSAAQQQCRRRRVIVVNPDGKAIFNNAVHR